MLWDYALRTLIGRTPAYVSQERAERKFGYHLHRKSVTLFSIILSMGARPWIQTMFLPGRLHQTSFFQQRIGIQSCSKSHQASGIVTTFRGAHVLRHSAATGMLQQGMTLQDIGSILRHRSIETTAHYATVDVKLLQLVVQPWPVVSS